MRFTQPTENDKADIMELWAKDFESYEPYFSWYFNTIYRPERTYVLKDNEEIAAAAQLAPYKMSMRGTEMDINFTVGVITQPELRGQGLGAWLMTELGKVEKDAGLPFSVLVAVCPEFYAKLGYCHCYEEQKLNIKIGELPKITGFDGKWQELNIEEAISPVLQVYSQMTTQLNGYILRTENNMRNFLTELTGDGGKIILYYENDFPQAYMLCMPQEGQFLLREMGFAAVHYQKVCLQYLQQNLPAETDLLWSAPDFAIKELNLQNAEITAKPGAMMRCRNVKKALEMLKPKENCSFSLCVTDKWDEDNNINIRFSSTDGKISIENTDEPAETAMDIISFTQLYCGFLSAAELKKQDRLTATEDALQQLELCFPKQQNWLSEQT